MRAVGRIENRRVHVVELLVGRRELQRARAIVHTPAQCMIVAVAHRGQRIVGAADLRFQARGQRLHGPQPQTHRAGLEDVRVLVNILRPRASEGGQRKALDGANQAVGIAPASVHAEPVIDAKVGVGGVGDRPYTFFAL